MDGFKFWANVEKTKNYMPYSHLARSVGLSYGVLRSMRNRGTLPRADVGIKIAEELGVELRDLLAEPEEVVKV